MSRVFRRVLVANRGEIAARVLATLQGHGIRGIAVYSDADADALHVRLADDAERLGPAAPSASYLNPEAILEAARRSGAEAIHPGYGFLSENADFAAAVERAGLVFIGPTPEQARRFGDKRAAREAARAAGVPVVPGWEPPGDAKPKAFAEAARQLGYPVIVKAALGGGGKGMQIVRDDAELAAAVESASRLAAAAFGEGSVYLEKAIERPRHVEAQIVGDGRGQVVHAFERECSLQRRHQKVIEETPSSGTDDGVRERLLAAAVALGRSVSYRGAGTVEFLVAPDGAFYFLEVNTRLQVEHPVTEMVTGLDLVWAQLTVAAGEGLPFAQEQVTRRGHAVEARVYAEDPAMDFLPQAGTLARVDWPRLPQVRIDAGVESGDAVPIHYDPILAKVVAWGRDRKEALHRLAHALDAATVHGVTTNLDFLRALARDPGVLSGSFDNEYLESRFLPRYRERAQEPAPALAAAIAALAESQSLGGTTAVAGSGARRDAAAADPFAQLGAWRHPGLGEP